MAIQIVTTLNSSNLGDVGRAKELPAGSKEVITLGRIIGKVKGLSYRNNPQDPSTPSIALSGMFEGIPADNPDVRIQSSRCFIQPSNIHELLVKTVLGNEKMATEKSPPKGKSIEQDLAVVYPIAIEVGVIKSDSPVGYSYVGTLLNKEVDAQDDLSDLRSALPPPGSTKMLAPAAKSAASKSLPAPKKRGKK